MLETMTEPLRIRQVVLGEGFPKICVPLTARDEKTLEEEAVGAVREQPDLIEWRADFFEKLSDTEAPGFGRDSFDLHCTNRK